MASKNLTKLHSVKGHRGISFRLRADGSKRFYISFKGSYVSTMDDDITPLLLLGPAIERQGQLTGKRIRGEQVRRPQKVTFAAAAEAYMEHAQNRPRRPLDPDTAKEYQRFLDNTLVPGFGQRLIGSIQAEEIEQLTAELLKKHRSESAAANVATPPASTTSGRVQTLPA